MSLLKSLGWGVVVCLGVVSSAGLSSAKPLVLTPDGSTLFVVNADSGSVSAINTLTDEKSGEVYVGKDPHNLVLSPDGTRLYVICQGSHMLVTLDTETFSVVAKLRVSAQPYDAVTDLSGDFLYVSSAAMAVVEVIDLRLHEQEIVAQIPVGPKPKGLALHPNGTRLYVVHFLTGNVSVIDPRDNTFIQEIQGRSDDNMVQRIVIHPSNGRAYIPNIRSNSDIQNLFFKTTVFPVVSVLDLGLNSYDLLKRMEMAVIVRAQNMPFDVAFSPDGQRMYVASMGSADLSVLDVETRVVMKYMNVGEGPRGVVVTPDDKKVYVTNWLTEDVSVIETEGHTEIKRIRVTNSPLSETLKRGKLLFFSSHPREISKNRWISCASCHFEGEHDGRTWNFSAGPRNTTSMRGIAKTGPIHWSADRDEIQDFENSIRTLQLGTGLIQDGLPNPDLGAPNAGLSEDLDALAAFTNSLQFRPNPFRSPDGSLSPEATRGQAIFERVDVGCTSCHAAPLYTDSTLAASPFIVHNVGTGDGPTEALGGAFDTPSLLGLWDSAPYLHDGSAPTLRDVLTTKNLKDQHGKTSHLSEPEIQDVVAFLLSLEEAESRIEDLERLD